jgi:hypothetical protein
MAFPISVVEIEKTEKKTGFKFPVGLNLMRLLTLLTVSFHPDLLWNWRCETPPDDFERFDSLFRAARATADDLSEEII